MSPISRRLAWLPASVSALLPGLLPVLLLAQAASAADPELRFEKYQLSNGLTVISSEDHRLPQVAINLWYHVGAADQAPGRSGFAHLFEHMMFSGSKHVQPSSFAVLEPIGATNINGSTNFDRTNYYETVPSSELGAGLWVESDRMAFLLDTLDAQKLKIQRDVVANEHRQRYENQPYGRTSLRRCELLYPLPHPYSGCVIGSVPEIQAATVEDLQAFFRSYYGPQNASLSLVGDFDPAAARLLVEKYFGAIPRGPEVKRTGPPQPRLAGVVRETLEDKASELPQLSLSWTAVKPYADDEAAGQVLATILGGGRTSRLYQSLVFDQQVASEVSAALRPLSLGGFFVIEVNAEAGHQAAELLPLVQVELEAIKRDGPLPVEVERAQRRFIAGRVRALERIGTRADLLNSYETELGDPGFLPRDLARYRAVTPEAVQAFASRVLLDGERLELVTLPARKAVAP